MRPTLPILRIDASAIAIGLSYGALAAAAIELTRLSHGIALMWVANAPLIAALCVWHPRRHLALITWSALGLVVAQIATSPMRGAIPAFVLADIGEAVLAAWLLRRMGIADRLFRSIESIPLFVIAAGVAAPGVSGFIGASTAHLFLGIAFGKLWLDWLIGHGLGNLIVMPLALLVVTPTLGWRYLLRPGRGAQALCLIALTGAATWLVFRQSDLPLLFLPMLPVVIGTFMLRRLGAAASIVVVAIVGGVMTIDGHGPVMLVHGGQAMQLQFFQFYLAILFITALPIAATLTQRDQLMRALGESEARYRLLADNATDIMLTLEPDGTIRFASPSIRELGFFEPESLIGTNAAALVHPDDHQRVVAIHREALAAPERNFTVEYRAIKANGDIGWFETNTRGVRDVEGAVTAVVSVIRDLNWRKRREAELEHAASTDPLTGLLNRSAFRAAVADAAAHASRAGHPATLALLDVDHFKRVNDDHGHAAGDAALLMLADHLRENLRPEDAVGRIGGEEFGLLFTDLSVIGATAICERLRASLSRREIVTAAGERLGIRVSLGVCAVSPLMPIDSAFLAADDALYLAKANGRDRTEVAVRGAVR